MVFYRFETECYGEGLTEQEHIHRITGTIVVDEDDDSKQRSGEVQAGTFSAYLFEVGRAFNDGADIYDEADSLDGEAEAYLRAVVTDELVFKSDVAQCLELDSTIVPNRILVVNAIEVYPEFRGRMFGHGTVEAMTKLYGGGCDLVLLKAEPMQKSREQYDGQRAWLDRMRLPSYSSAHDRKLRVHWGKMGFSRLGLTPYMMKALHEE